MAKRYADWLRLSDVPAYYYHVTDDKIPTDRTIFNWVRHGRRTYDNVLVRLTARFRHGLWMTRKAWVDEFINRIKGVTISEIPERDIVDSGRNDGNSVASSS